MPSTIVALPGLSKPHRLVRMGEQLFHVWEHPRTLWALMRGNAHGLPGLLWNSVPAQPHQLGSQPLGVIVDSSYPQGEVLHGRGHGLQPRGAIPKCHEVFLDSEGPTLGIVVQCKQKPEEQWWCISNYPDKQEESLSDQHSKGRRHGSVHKNLGICRVLANRYVFHGGGNTNRGNIRMRKRQESR